MARVGFRWLTATAFSTAWACDSMSYVDSILLCISCGEEFTEGSAPDYVDTYELIERINAWLAERDFSPLLDITDRMGGSKSSQMIVFGAAYNHFSPRTDFAALARSMPWICPDAMVLIMNPEEGATEVVRPKMGTEPLNENLYALGDFARR